MVYRASRAAPKCPRSRPRHGCASGSSGDWRRERYPARYPEAIEHSRSRMTDDRPTGRTRSSPPSARRTRDPCAEPTARRTDGRGAHRAGGARWAPQGDRPVAQGPGVASPPRGGEAAKGGRVRGERRPDHRPSASRSPRHHRRLAQASAIRSWPGPAVVAGVHRCSRSRTSPPRALGVRRTCYRDRHVFYREPSGRRSLSRWL